MSIKLRTCSSSPVFPIPSKLRTGWAKFAADPRVARHGMSLWPPFLGAGITVRDISADWRSCTVELRQLPWNRNYVGVHFGGSLFAMTDPFWMMMVLHNMGPGYVVWDKAAEISFLKPGRGVLRCDFRLSAESMDHLRSRADALGKATTWFQVDILDASGDVVAAVRKEVYVRAESGGKG